MRVVGGDWLGLGGDLMGVVGAAEVMTMMKTTRRRPTKARRLRLPLTPWIRLSREIKVR